LKHFKIKNVLLLLLVITGAITTLCAAKLSFNKPVDKEIKISTNELLGLKEGPAKVQKKKSDNPLLFDTTYDMIVFYSKVFELNSDVIYKKMEEIISLDINAWNNDNTIDGKTYSSKEEAILRTINDIYSNPVNYGLNKNEISSNNGYELSDIKPEELVYKFSTVLNVNPTIALAIAYCECGYKLNSYNFVNKHNIGGIRGSNGFVRYKNEAYGIYKYVSMLHNGYGVDENSGRDKIISMSKKYCGGSQHWINVVTDYYNGLNQNGFESYYSKSKHDRNLNIPYLPKEISID